MPKPSLNDIIKKYERRQQLVIYDVLKQIYSLFESFVNDIAFYSAKRRLINNRFLPADVRAAIERITITINAKSKDIIINGIKRSWDLANDKNDEIQTLAEGGRRKPPPGTKVRVIPSPGGRRKAPYTSVDAFIKRKEQGMSLSKRVWKLSSVYKKTLSETVKEGLKEGASARVMAKQLRFNLRNNDIVARPGQGVYRSPKKNAERLARSEINMAYANADYVRWNQQWFVVGIEVRLSNAHPKFDICDYLKGKYPKDFVFEKWHPQCLCNAVPILAPQGQRDQMMDYKLGITDEKPSIKYVTNIPGSAGSWMARNADRVNGWKHQPYWKIHNRSYTDQFFKNNLLP